MKQNVVYSKKSILRIILILLVLSHFSCYTAKRESADLLINEKSQGRKIVSLVKKSGEFIEFPKDSPAKILGNEIVWNCKFYGEKVLIQGEGKILETYSISLYEVDQAHIKQIDSTKTILGVLGALATPILITLLFLAAEADWHIF